jgi:hypothetical protein
MDADNKMLKRIVLIAGVSLLQLFSGNAFALGMFSRACPIADIPSPLKLPALMLFEAIGDAEMGSLIKINNFNNNEQYNWWVLESLTVDWASLRYYLFAENKIYRYNDYKNAYFLEGGYKSPGWVAMSLNDDTLSDSRFQIFFKNRGFMYSGRAGHKNIVQRWERTPLAPGSSPLYKDFWKVMGQHYYYDPVSKVIAYLGSSMAEDCNLREWGLEAR